MSGLTDSYINIFKAIAAVATLPSLLIFGYCVDDCNPKASQIALGLAACLFFSTAVLVL